MEESLSSKVSDGIIRSIRFSLATPQEICKSSISDCPISHPSLLLNPYLGLPLETGRCESCGTAEPGQCEGHFGYIELPIPIYHPDHVTELKNMLNLLCLKCLKMKNRTVQSKHPGVFERTLSSCCLEASHVSIHESKNSEGASFLELKVPKKGSPPEWNFLEKYGYRYGDGFSRPLLPSEVLAILKRIPKDARKKLSAKGYFPQDGYILEFLPVPPNCLSVPDISDGNSIMSSDHSITMLRKVLRQIDIIKSSRSGTPNFEAHEVEANDLQATVVQYLQFRGTGKATRDVDKRFGVSKEAADSTTKAWLEKMKTLFIRKGSGFSSRSVITGDPYKAVGEIGLPSQIAEKITFEERVSQHNMGFLQKLVDEKLCLTFRDGLSTYSLREGSKGHTHLRPGQIVHRRIMDGDIVFINRPPTTHKHSLQALSVYVHDDHTVKINPLICGPLSADFDGDCIHLFYPQSLSAKAEVVELFSVGKQLLSSHTGNFNLQLATDSMLSLKLMLSKYFFSRAAAQQLAMFLQKALPDPALVDVRKSGSIWTSLQILEAALPDCFDSCGETHTVRKSQLLEIDYSKDSVSSILNDIITSIYFMKGPNDVLKFFNSLQPLLMEYLCTHGFTVSLRDFYMPKAARDDFRERVRCMSEEVQLENDLRKELVSGFILKSGMGVLIDSKSESALNKVIQQIGYLGMQISEKGKFYSKTLVDDMTRLFQKKYPSAGSFTSEESGLVRSCLFYGLDPFEGMVHSISSREVIVRSTRGLTEPGTLFKNLMAILRDVIICYDGTVRNVSSNSIIQFEYGVSSGTDLPSEFCAGDPVGVLAATAMSNPAYKAVLDSSPSSNSSWEMMKEILLSRVRFKNDDSDRRVILYLNDCGCGRKEGCKEKAACLVKNHLTKVCLKDAADEFLIEYGGQQRGYENSETGDGLIGHIHLNQGQLGNLGINVVDVLERCQEKISSFRRKKKVANLFKRIVLSVSEYCSFCHISGNTPCLRFSWPDAGGDDHLERLSRILADMICPVLLDTVIKGDPRVSSANIVWMNPDTTTLVKNPSKSQNRELAVDVFLEKDAVKQSGDAWRILMDSCLPVIHLIDTGRSTPYAIKQIQELLGISCAFEQAVKRLSTSVTMVTKGVLKDHLVLLANSMTCTGNLIGFNAGGIKALSRSLNMQIPFTEATLFTPRKCFERAAEKCHVDSLSSIVASCSWGKHVAVGTGSPFEVLWNTKNVEMNTPDALDVYNFLHLVRSSSSQQVEGTSCLGAEVDELEQEDEEMGLYLSPDRDSATDKPTFEDGAEFENGNLDEGNLDGGSSWDQVASQSVKSGGGWDMAAGKTQNGAEKDGLNQSDSWSSWGVKKVEGAETTWGKKVDSNVEQSEKVEQSGSWSAWGRKDGKVEQAESNPQQSGKGEQWSTWGKKMENDSDGSSWGKKPEKDSGGSSWGKKVDEAENSPHQSGNEVLPGPPPLSSWGKKAGNDGGSSWGKKDGGSWGKKINETGNEEELQGPPALSSWGKKSGNDGGSSWGKKDGGSSWGTKINVTSGNGNEELPGPPPSSSWGKKSGNDGGSSWGKKDGGSAWGKKINETSGNEEKLPGPPPLSSWGKKDGNDGGSSWGKKEGGSSWGKKINEVSGNGNEELPGPPPLSSWGKKAGNDGGSSWGKKVNETSGNEEELPRPPPLSSWGKKAGNDGGSSWGKKDGGSSWGKKINEKSGNEEELPGPPPLPSWCKKAGNDGGSSWGKKASEAENEISAASGSWGVKKDEVSLQADNNDAWGAKTKSKSPQAHDWGKKGAGEEAPVNDQSGGNSTEVGGWGSTKVGGWDSQNEAGAEESDKQQPQWGQRRRNFKGDASRGWGSTGGGDWKNQRNRPPRSGDDSNFNRGVPLTATRQRKDIFTDEEQEILSVIEPVMLNTRRIMHQTGYNDGDALSAEDQTYIIDNVFNYHPDKELKMGAGLDYIMTSKHSEFQDTRCFYAVSTDGGKQDFSTLKCLENFVRSKYPDKADSFNGKYFKKPQPRKPVADSPPLPPPPPPQNTLD